MSWRSMATAWIGLLALATGGARAAAATAADERLAAAKRFVDHSDRYLHHSKLKRGDEGYGLTVMAGTKVVRFKAKVVSVIANWSPHQDVILAMLSEQKLEHTGVIGGMSGSPIYFKDPADGKHKCVGAVAYGWSSNKDPLCGIQPITQMLAVGRYYEKFGAAAKPAKPSAKTASVADEPAGGPPAGRGVEEFLTTILDPRKLDFALLCLPPRRRQAFAARQAGPRLVPLGTPLMVAGSHPRTIAELGRTLEPMGIVPVASGGVNAAVAAEVRKARLVPGGALSVPLVTGDSDWSAVGTVTDVVNGRVLGFGHSYFGEGDVKLPMGPAYVHTVVAGLTRSFKISAGLAIRGTLERDEQVGVGGRIGPKPAMVPMTVNVRHADGNRKETFHYNICNHRYMTGLFSRYMLMDSAWAWHEVPEHHTVRYTVTVHYGKLGTFRSSNISTGDDISPAISDLGRPIAGMLQNPYGKRTAPSRIEVDLVVEKGDLSASMLALRLKGEVYRPGETLTGTLLIRPYRSDRKVIPLQFKLPDDLPEGTYSLSVCDAASALSQERSETPHRFAPRTTQRLLEAMQRIVDPPARQLYLRMPLPTGGGLALADRELPDLPPSKAQILAQAQIYETRTFRRSLVQTLKTHYIINGSLRIGFKVRKEPAETILRK